MYLPLPTISTLRIRVKAHQQKCHMIPIIPILLESTAIVTLGGSTQGLVHTTKFESRMRSPREVLEVVRKLKRATGREKIELDVMIMLGRFQACTRPGLSPYRYTASVVQYIGLFNTKNICSLPEWLCQTLIDRTSYTETMPRQRRHHCHTSTNKRGKVHLRYIAVASPFHCCSIDVTSPCPPKAVIPTMQRPILAIAPLRTRGCWPW